MYSLDIGKFDKWVTLISQNTQQEWIGEKDEEDEEEGEEEGGNVKLTVAFSKMCFD